MKRSKTSSRKTIGSYTRRGKALLTVELDPEDKETLHRLAKGELRSMAGMVTYLVREAARSPHYRQQAA